MATKSFSGKLIAIILILLVGAAACYGYFKQEIVMSESEAKNPAKAIDTSMLVVKPTDIVLGDMNALTTIVEYMSLSCSHCAHFHETVLPDIQKEFITTGKVKLVLRHFPLNPPAMIGAQVVECAGNDGKDRATLIKVLMQMQPKWAYDDNYIKNLKQIVAADGIDSAAFDSCMKDKTLETRLLTDRKDAETKLGIDGTPAFFINGVKYDGDRNIEGFRTAITDAAKDAPAAETTAPAAAKAPEAVATPAKTEAPAAKPATPAAKAAQPSDEVDHNAPSSDE